MKHMERDAVIIFRLPLETRRALERAAEAEHRKLSSMALHIVTAWLEQGGYLAKPGSQVRRKKQE